MAKRLSRASMGRSFKGLLRRSLGPFATTSSMSAEQTFRFLARRLASDYGNKGKTVLLVAMSAQNDPLDADEAMQLASLLQDETGMRVLLLDSDFSGEIGLSQAFGCADEPGLAELLDSERADPTLYFHETAQAGVVFLPRGPGLDDVDRSAFRENLAQSLTTAAAGFGYVVAVQPGVTADTRGFEMVRHGDCVLLLAREGRTRLADIEDQEAALTQNSKTDIRIVLSTPGPLLAESR